MMKSLPSKINIEKLLENHFADDRANFAKMDKRNDKTETLLSQMGEHLSYLRKDMNIITKTQENHAKESTEFRESIYITLKEIKDAVAPLISQNNDKLIVRKELKSVGEWITGVGSVVIAIGAIFSGIIYAIRKFL